MYNHVSAIETNLLCISKENQVILNLDIAIYGQPVKMRIKSYLVSIILL
jgi:hypothetical protein